jgi:hypothetical protein
MNQLDKQQISDPMERMIADALDCNGIRYVHEEPNTRLDFYLPDFDVYIEVKQFHSDWIARQMSRASNVIALQGRRSCELFAALISKDYVRQLLSQPGS